MTYSPFTEGSKDYFTEVARGNITGQKVIHKFGSNLSVGTTLEDVWSAGGLYTWMTTAATLEAISTSANDAAAGTGARTITVEGLDASWNELSEDITMNGTSASTATTGTFTRVNRAYVKATGTYVTNTISGSNDGDIAIRVSGGGATQCELLNSIKFAQTQVGRFSVPSGKIGYVDSMLVHIDSSKPTDVYFWHRTDADTVAAPFTSKHLLASFIGLVGPSKRVFKTPLVIGTKTDVWASAAAKSGTSSVEFEFSLRLIDI